MTPTLISGSIYATRMLGLILGLAMFAHCSSSAEMAQQEGTWAKRFETLQPLDASSFTLRNKENLPIPDGESSYHQQGIQRLEDGGWAVSGSNEGSGYLYFTDAAGTIHTKFTVPNDLKLQGGAAQLAYNHPGGFQVTNNILAVGLEQTDFRRNSYARIVLLEVSDPQAPVHLSHLDIVREAEEGKVMTAGAVGITELKDGYLIAVGNWDSKRFDFYQTSGKDLKNPGTTVSSCLGSWTPGKEGNSYQNFNLYGDSLESIHAIGLYSIDRREDWADVLQLDVSNWDDIRLTQKREMEYKGGQEDVRFVHAAGTYYDLEASRMVVFSTEAHAHNGVVRCNIW